MVDYKKRLVEVDEVISYLSEENINKIPENVRKLIKENMDNWKIYVKIRMVKNMDKNYTWKFDETKKLREQNLSRDTIIILSYLNMEYLLNDEQRKLMEQIHELNEQKQEEQRKEKYKVEEIFENKEIPIQLLSKEEVEQEKSLVEYKENIFRKIINKIKEFFGFLRIGKL